MTKKERGFGAAWRAVRGRGGVELARSSVKRFREADGTSHVRALAYQSMFVLLSGFIGLVGLASAFDMRGSEASSSRWPTRFLLGRPAGCCERRHVRAPTEG
jgi:hypothetical protein